MYKMAFVVRWQARVADRKPKGRTASDDEVEEECCATVETGEVIGRFWGWVR